MFDTVTKRDQTNHGTVLQCQSKFITPASSIWSVPASGTRTYVDPTEIVIRPSSTSSTIVVQWMITYETTHDAVWEVYKNKSYWQGGYNSGYTRNAWVGYAPCAYDNNVDSTPKTQYISMHDVPGTTADVSYGLAIGYASGGSTWLWLNRSASGTISDAYEVGTSHVIAWEIL